MSPARAHIRSFMFQGNDAANLGGTTTSTSTTSTTDPFIAQYRTVYDSLTTPPSAGVADAQNTMVSSIVATNTWAKLDYFLLLAQEINSDGEALKNWILPGTNDAIMVNAPAFVSLEGFTPDGSTSYINTNWNPTVDGSNFTQNACSWGLYSRTNVSESEEDFGTVDSGAWIYALLRYDVLNRFYGALNDGGRFVTNTDSRGFFMGSRTDADNQKLYKNKVDQGATIRTTVGLPNDDLFIGAYSSAGNPIFGTTKQYACFFTGGTLTQGDIDSIVDSVETYMDSNGKGVIT